MKRVQIFTKYIHIFTERVHIFTAILCNILTLIQLKHFLGRKQYLN